MKTKSITKLRRRRDAFCNIKNVKDLEKLLNESSFSIHLLALKPDYHIFTVPKKNGKKKWIEDSVENLKRIQRSLNFYLQCVYNTVKAPYSNNCPKRSK